MDGFRLNSTVGTVSSYHMVVLNNVMRVEGGLLLRLLDGVRVRVTLVSRLVAIVVARLGRHGLVVGTVHDEEVLWVDSISRWNKGK